MTGCYYIPAFWCGRRSSTSVLVKLKQIAVDSPQVQHCNVCSGANRSDEVCQLAIPSDIKTNAV